MTKLTYTHIANDSIIVDLHNGYSIVALCNFNHQTKKYEVTLYIKNSSIDILDMIEKQEKVEFATNYKTINSAILKHISTLLSEGFFDYYIRRYEYLIKCFDKGNEIFEHERLGIANDN